MEGCCSRFTAAEGGARLAAAASTKNTLTVEYSSFISTRIIYEDGYKIRGCLSNGYQRSVYISRASRVQCVSYELNLLTDLNVLESLNYDDVSDWRTELENKEVLVCTSRVLKKLLEDGVLSMSNINVLVLDSCHLVCKDDNLKYILKLYKECDEIKRPRILALTYPLFSPTKDNSDKKDITKTIEKDETDSKEINDNDFNDSIECEKNAGLEIDVTDKDITESDTSIKDIIEENTEAKDKTTKEDEKSETEKDDDIGLCKNLDDFAMYEKLEWKMEELEKELCCQMDLAEDIDSGKRLSGSVTKPKELIIEYSAEVLKDNLPEEYLLLEEYMRDTVNDAMAFINEHRYDPTEIYGDDMYEEFMSIPDPTIDPKCVFNQFLYVLDQLGPYAADKAAFSLLTKLEKLKIKVPYERHFLLLCLCTTVFIKIRCYADLIFSKYNSDWEKIQIFCTPKVLRFAEILEKFQPTNQSDKKVDNNERKENLLNEIDKCDFIALSNKIEDRVNTYNANLKEIHDLNDIVHNQVNDSDNQVDKSDNQLSKSGDQLSKSDNQLGKSDNRLGKSDNQLGKSDNQSDKSEQKCALGFQRRTHRIRGRGRVPRNNAARLLQMQQNPDALCGIVFMKEALMAKIMFLLIVDMSRSNSKLSYICAQYCAVEQPADPGTEPRECQRQGKKQEDVLKKFRMHECNLLLATSALEEGIDLPRCNLVLRWDVPASYRSYGLCRGRARAARSTCAVLSASIQDNTDMLVHNLATYRELDQIISRKCGCGIQDEPPQTEEDYADAFTKLVKAYSPEDNEKSNENTNNCDNHIDKDNRLDSKLSKNIPNSQSIKTSSNCDDNLICNKCNNKKSSGIECPCVVSVNSSDKDNRIDKKCEGDNVASVDLSTAIALINRYCGKLPSDTFTRLAPQWWIEQVRLPVHGSEETRVAYICTLRLPLNCPVKYNIVGHPMPTRVLARRMVALQACRILHKSGELDDQLMPIGKENFKAVELESNINYNTDIDGGDTARPGTSKRRQYYFKRTAWAFTDCQPLVDATDSEVESPPEPNLDSKQDAQKGTKRNMLYSIMSHLWCSLPERYNTRGRRLHAPQHAQQALAILMSRHHPDSLQIPSFPVYTRSGEVRVSVEHVPDADVRISPRRVALIRRFMRFVFAEVLRVRRRGMKLQTEGSTHNNYYIVPTIKTTKEDGTTKIDVDWNFLELIYKHTEEKKLSDIEKLILFNEDEVRAKEKTKELRRIDNPLLKEGEVFEFDPEKYKEAVVTPWYRNQDQPQFFLVAEICWNLTPESSFPSATHTSFRNYYSSKYGVQLTQSEQPLLDVDHTSARLNLLTPRYVNRKGVALPVSSERTRRAKRDRLDQKQILVPELCRVHPFAAPLWFATVALPCVLYRINALLIADEIRRAVAIDVGLGIPKIDDRTCPGFCWPPLDFGWSLAEVLSADLEKCDKKKDEEDIKTEGQHEVVKYSDEEKTSLKAIEENKENGVEKTINDILQEKEDAASGFEIGTWSNDMASSLPQVVEYDEFNEPLPPILTFCTSDSGGKNWCDPIVKPKMQFNPSRTFSMADSDCSYMSSDFDTDDTDLNSEGSDDDTDTTGFCSSKFTNAAMGVRIEYKTAHEAEAVDVERKKKINPAPQPDDGDDARDKEEHDEFIRAGVAPEKYVNKFRQSVTEHKKDIINNGNLIYQHEAITEILPEPKVSTEKHPTYNINKQDLMHELFPYDEFDGEVTLETIEKNKRRLLGELKKTLTTDKIKSMNCFSMVDVDIDSPEYVNEKIANVGFDTSDNYKEKIEKGASEFKPYYQDNRGFNGKEFDFDYQPDLEGHPGPSPSVILQALTMSNANDGINLERLETIGDSFLKFAITAYLYCAHPTVHEGKLSHMRSKQVSNLNLYRLGRNKRLGARMIASKFEPHDNWLPPCHKPPPTLHPTVHGDSQEAVHYVDTPLDSAGCFIPYNLITQHSIPDKSIADCVEALIGAYLLECGPRGALLFMSWLGIRVLPAHRLVLPPTFTFTGDTQADQVPKTRAAPKRQRELTSDSECSDDEEPWPEIEELTPEDWTWPGRPVGSLRPYKDDQGRWIMPIFGDLKAPPSPLLRYIEDPEGELEQMLSGYEALEATLQYRFRDRSLLLQALTHASHQKNRLTDCYQRLEFLGDAILDYLITRHLYEDPRRHSPGALTDLRSALVNNTIFATLAARHGFHKYFRHMSPGLNEVLTKYVRIQEENGHSISEEHYLIQEDEMEQAEDVEVPKALGDLFESVAGAIFLDSGMSLGAVWKSYVNLMGAELEAFSAAAPKSPVRELLEAEPDTAKFGKPERLADGRRVRVCVEVFGRGTFKGVGRNYRIAKGTAARCALRHLKIHRAR